MQAKVFVYLLKFHALHLGTVHSCCIVAISNSSVELFTIHLTLYLLSLNYSGSTLTVVSRPYLQFRSLLRFIKSFIISTTGTIKDFQVY